MRLCDKPIRLELRYLPTEPLPAKVQAEVSRSIREYAEELLREKGIETHFVALDVIEPREQPAFTAAFYY